MINDKDISIVFQGAIDDNFLEFALKTRKTLPNATIIVSTWSNAVIPIAAPVDIILRSADPGSLPGIKLDAKPNNINRQILSTRVGLEAVKTQYAVKMRTDSYLEHAGFLEEFNTFKKDVSIKERIITTSFFSIDPNMYEHIPFHLSDWFQFSETSTLLGYWQCPYMTEEEATYYESNPYKKNSSYFDKKFRVKHAVEQFIAVNYATLLGYEIPKFHNDNRKCILKAHEQFVAKEFLILDPWQAGIVFPKYFWAYESTMQRFNCLMNLDWINLYIKNGGSNIFNKSLLTKVASRIKSKKRVAIGIALINPFANFYYSSKYRKIKKILFKLVGGG